MKLIRVHGLALPAAIILVLATPSLSAVAQQDPLDVGLPDSVFVVIPQPRLGLDSVAAVELYFFNDAQPVVAASLGLTWDTDKFRLDSVTFSSAARAAFSFFRYTFYKGSADSSNACRLFQCAIGGFPEDALPAGSQRKLIATYYFHITNWAAGESFCVDWTGFVSASFVDPVIGEYSTNWRGSTCAQSGPDGDGDGIGDQWDNCPALANSNQSDLDSDNIGDLCDICTDSDHDGFGNPGFEASICALDNCPENSNPGQEDADHDGFGDACDPDCCAGRVGDANGIGSYPNEVTISDIQTLVVAKFIQGTCDGVVWCLTEGDVNQSGGANPTCRDITISDIQALVNHLFIAGQVNAPLKDCL